MEKQILIAVDDHQLSGVLHLPENSGKDRFPVVIICHGFIGSKVGQHRIFVKTARQISNNGIAVLRFDFGGCGESSGEYRDITLARQIKETVAVINLAAAHPNIDADRIVLLGHSLGGCVAASVAGLDKRVGSLVLWSPVARPFTDIVSIVGEDIYRECLQKSVVNYQGFELGADFFTSLTRTHPLERVKDFSGRVMVIHGSADVDTPLENAFLYRQALSDRFEDAHKLYIIEDADHTYNSQLWEQQVIRLTLDWLEQV